MKKTLLVGINSKYIHSNLAIHSIKEYCKIRGVEVETAEYTINNNSDFIMADIYKKKPKILAFSCYIWNIDYVLKLSENIRRIMPEIIIIYGGPEVSYDSRKLIEQCGFVDIIIKR